MSLPDSQRGDVGQRPVSGLRLWLADLTYTQRGVAAETMPQAVGGLSTYLASRIELPPVRIFKYPEVLAAALSKDSAPDVIGFSNYIWNSSLSLGFAGRIRRKFPATIIVMGGPHYPLHHEEQERFWTQRFAGAVDFYIEGEAEVAFAELVTMLANGHRHDVRSMIPGVHSLDVHGSLHHPPPDRRLADLSVVPSAYLAGMMDPFFDGTLVPTVQTNRGCPFSCTFCAEGTRYFSKVSKKNTDRIAAELHYIGQRMAPLLADARGRNELLITDSNFGMFPEDLATCDVIAQCQDAYGWPRYVNVTTGKNRRDRVLEAVRRTRGAITLSGAVQSLDEEVLSHVRRSNISADQLMDVALAAAEQGTGTYSEVILGLPGDSKTKHFASLDRLVAAGFGRINMFQLSFLPGSELCHKEARDRFGMDTRWRVIPRCVGRYPVLGSPMVAAEVDEICVQFATTALRGLSGLPQDEPPGRSGLQRRSTRRRDQGTSRVWCVGVQVAGMDGPSPGRSASNAGDQRLPGGYRRPTVDRSRRADRLRRLPHRSLSRRRRGQQPPLHLTGTYPHRRPERLHRPGVAGRACGVGRVPRTRPHH